MNYLIEKTNHWLLNLNFPRSGYWVATRVAGR